MASRSPNAQQIFFPQSSIEQSRETRPFAGHRIGAKPYGSNNDLVSISNHVPNINCEVRDLLHQFLKPLRTFLQIILVVAWQFMIVEVWSHIPKNGLNISTVHRFEVTLYKLSVYACLIHASLSDLIDALRHQCPL